MKRVRVIFKIFIIINILMATIGLVAGNIGVVVMNLNVAVLNLAYYNTCLKLEGDETIWQHSKKRGST